MIYNVYQISDTENQKNFEFLTQYGITYFLKLSKASYRFKDTCLNCSNIYEFSFYPNSKSKFDPNVKSTIIEFVKKFIHHFYCPILFICDSSDNHNKEAFRAISRLKIFNDWNDGSHQYETRKYQFEHYDLYLGIIASHDDENFYKYFEELDEICL